MEMQSLLNQSLLDSSSSTNSEEREEREWIIRIEDLTFSERISEGSFGVVFKGLYRNSPVAIKIIKNSSNDESFHHEVRVLKSLRHPNIVLFMGVCLKDDNKFIVTELMMGKSLEHLLYQATSRLTADASPFNLHRNITFTHKIHLLLDVVKGMIYLHNLEPPLLHRDLKPSNILVSLH
jgi:serine/threonine protein kinase